MVRLDLGDELKNLIFPKDEFRLLQLAEAVVRMVFWRRTASFVSQVEAIQVAIGLLKLSVIAQFSDGYSEARDELFRALRIQSSDAAGPGDEECLSESTEESLVAEIRYIKVRRMG